MKGETVNHSRSTERLNKALAWFNRLPLLVQLPVAVGILFFLAAVAITAAVFGGQIFALGSDRAAQIYGNGWLRVILSSFPAGAVIGFAVIAPIYIVAAIADKLRDLVSKPVRNVLRTLMWILAGITIMLLMIRGAYDNARKEHPLSNAARLPDSVAVQKVLIQQTGVLDGASESARMTIANLDRTEGDLQKLRSEVVKALSKIEEQRTAAQKISETASKLQSNQADIDERLRNLRRLLDGSNPITKADLASSQRNGLWQGFVIGLVASLMAAYIFRWLERRLGRTATNS